MTFISIPASGGTWRQLVNCVSACIKGSATRKMIKLQNYFRLCNQSGKIIKIIEQYWYYFVLVTKIVTNSINGQ